jgi:hypothetical protein
MHILLAEFDPRLGGRPLGTPSRRGRAASPHGFPLHPEPRLRRGPVHHLLARLHHDFERRAGARQQILGRAEVDQQAPRGSFVIADGESPEVVALDVPTRSLLPIVGGRRIAPS